MNTNRQRLGLLVCISFLLAAGAACSSDKGAGNSSAPATHGELSDDTRATGTNNATEATAAAATVVAAGTTAPIETVTTFVTEATQAASTVDSVQSPTSPDDRQAIVEYLRNLAAAAGVEIDEQLQSCT